MEAPLSDTEPIRFEPRAARGSTVPTSSNATRRHAPVTFNRSELEAILAVYGRKVACGEWRDYALDMTHERATFSIFRRACEWPLFRVEKNPKLARRRGTYAILAASGAILKRGPDLRSVLAYLDRPHLVAR